MGMKANRMAVERTPEWPLRKARSHLFSLRIWLVDLGSGETEWRGKLQDVVSGQNHYFRDWPALIQHLNQMLSEADSIQVTWKDEA